MHRRDFLKRSAWVSTGLIFVPRLIRAQQIILTGDSKITGDASLVVPQSTGSSQPSPIAWWKFDDGSGTTAADSSGNGHTGTLTIGTGGLPAWISGHISGAVQTNNTNNFVNVSSSAFNLGSATAPFSIATWINIPSGAGANAVIGGYRNTTPGNALLYFCVGNNALGGAGNGKISIDVRDDSSGGLTEVVGSTAVNTGAWVHVCVTRNSSKLLTLYVNGTSDGSGSDTMGTTLTVTSNWIGADPGNTGFQANTTVGYDDYRIYNVALTQPQVSFLAAM